GDSLAAEWIAKQFERLGVETLNGNRFEPFTFPVNTFPDSVRVVVDGRTLRPGVDYITDPASGTADGHYPLMRVTPAEMSTPQRRGITLSTVVGKAVYLDLPKTTNSDSLRFFTAWEQELVRNAPVLRKGGDKLTWSVAGEQYRNALIEVMPGLIPDSATSVDLRVHSRLIARHQARNVFGVVKARSNSKQWLVLSAHYDHLGHMGPDVIFPGANDNASGISMLLCLAEYLKAHPLKVNVLFIAFAGEEAGLKGSEWCVVDRPIDLATISLMINLDLNGTGDDGITVVNATALPKVYDKLLAINTRTQRLAQVKSRGPACNSDHCPFVQKGVPAVFIYTMGGSTAYHDVNDTAANLTLVEFDDLYRTLIGLVKDLK
ncbi:MAG TPA: M28 family peptidase, partial [Flavobacteriales bacterium]|nr:M28 family peptidase [Flavobacteriales bacterium]